MEKGTGTDTDLQFGTISSTAGCTGTLHMLVLRREWPYNLRCMPRRPDAEMLDLRRRRTAGIRPEPAEMPFLRRWRQKLLLRMQRWWQFLLPTLRRQRSFMIAE